MNNHKRRNFRPRQQKSGFRRRNGTPSQSQNGHYQSNNGNIGFNRNGSMSNPFNVEKTIQKFQQLAKDAQSSGDPVLVENYLQHADHYSRRLSELNSKIKPIEQEKKLISTPVNSSEENMKESASPDVNKTSLNNENKIKS
jgi:hypothetical protein